MIFTDFKIKNITHIRTGSVDLWIRKIGNEWFLYHCSSMEKLAAVIENTDSSDDFEWSRIISNIESDTVTISPAVPDRAVIVQSPDEIIIPEKQSSVFYIEIPLVLRLKIKSKPDIFLTDISSGFFSNTWYGDITGGILSYSLNTVISSDVFSEISPSSAVSRITVSNRSSSPVRFRKIAVYVQNMNIYEGLNNMLWTDDSSIAFSGNNEVKIGIEKKPRESGKKVFSNPRYSDEKNILKKGFTVILKSVTGDL